MRKTKKATDKELLKLWAEKVKELANYKCENLDCKARYNTVHAHHVFSRRHASLRYDPKNSLCLCPVCHTLGLFSAHKDPIFINRMISIGVRSAQWFEDLCQRRNIIVKNNQAYKDEWFKKLKEY